MKFDKLAEKISKKHNVFYDEDDDDLDEDGPEDYTLTEDEEKELWHLYYYENIDEYEEHAPSSDTAYEALVRDFKEYLYDEYNLITTIHH